MLPVIPQRWSVGTGHVSAGPRLSATQQAPSTRLPTNYHHCRQRCPPARSSYDFYGDAPPPYNSLRPSGSIAMRSINAEHLRGTARAGRRVMSESCASPYYGHDDDFLANLAAIQLLSGCTAISGRQSGARRCGCRIGCDGTACALEDLSLRMLSQELSKHPTRPVTIQATIHDGADGHMSLESTDRVQMCAYCRSTPVTPPISRERFPSEDLDRRLQSIADALHRDNCSNETSKKRLHTSEVSRKEQSFTTDDTGDVDHPHHDHDNVLGPSVQNTSRGILGALRNLQHKDRPKRWLSTYPSLDSSEMPPSSEAGVLVSRRIPYMIQSCSFTNKQWQVQEPDQRSLLEDRSNMVMQHSLRDRISKRLQARSSSPRYGDFTFDSSPRRRRRNGRYSSVCMSSAEPTPLFNPPVPNQSQVLGDVKSQPGQWKSAIDPLATSSLMLATVELDRLTNRQVSDRGPEVPDSGQSSTCGGPPNSPAMKSLAPRENSSLSLDTTSCASERSMIPRNTLPLAVTTRSGNSIPQSTAHAIRRQRMTSSRFSDVRTPENILEASDEDVSSTSYTHGISCTPQSLESNNQPLHSSLTSPEKTARKSCRTSEPGRAVRPVDQVIEHIPLGQDDPSKGFLACTSVSFESTSAVHHQRSLNDDGQPENRKTPVNHLHTGALTPQNTRGLWCPPRKSPSPPRRHVAWDPVLSTAHSNE